MQLPPGQLRGLVEFGHFGCCGALQSDGRADEEAGSACRFTSHSAVNNDMLKELQQLEGDLHRIYKLIKRNDTR